VTEDAKKLHEKCRAGQAVGYNIDDDNAKERAEFFKSLSSVEAEKLRRSFNVLARIGRFHGDRKNDTTPTRGSAPLVTEKNDVHSRIFRHWARVGGVKLCEDVSPQGTYSSLPPDHSCSYTTNENLWSADSLEYLELRELFPSAFANASDANMADNYCCKILENQYIFIHHLGIFGCLFSCLFCLFVSSLV
jgi:hypothetical protein